MNKNNKMGNIDINKYIINPNKEIKELFRNKSNDNLKKNSKINFLMLLKNKKSIFIFFSNISKYLYVNLKRSLIELNNIYNKINKSDSKNKAIKNKEKEKLVKLEINKSQNVIINCKSDRKNNNKLLDTITEFADNLNKYVDQHNSAQKCDKNLPSSFILNANEIEDLKIEECPKDSIRNKSKNNSENTINQLETNDATLKNIDEFTIVN